MGKQIIYWDELFHRLNGKCF